MTKRGTKRAALARSSYFNPLIWIWGLLRFACFVADVTTLCQLPARLASRGGHAGNPGAGCLVPKLRWHLARLDVSPARQYRAAPG